MPMHSTPTANDVAYLSELIGELGSQIGESIASRLLGNQTENSLIHHPSKNNNTGTPNPSVDLPKISVVVRSDVKEPPMFKGDDSDKYAVQEWIELMELYLKKSDCPDTEQVDTILSHLLGRAKNIVKVALKSSFLSNTPVKPESIYDILKHYFSESPGSCMPLADFYAPRPYHKESPVDYWVRFNTLAEHANEHLQSNGSKMENMSSEIAMMFIRNCPDPDLNSVFKCKPTNKWSMAEVQEAIDEHQREIQSRRASSMARPSAYQVSTAFVHHSDSGANNVEGVAVNAACMTNRAPEIVTPDSNALEPVLSMLERVLERTSQPPQHPPRPGTSSWSRPSPCRLCGDASHSTRSHCMRERRCLLCLQVGHQRKDCPDVLQSSPQPTTGSQNQGN
ncbi:hypothetical protein ACEWY4_013872 [Coilia grayii]|uniref:CCHC-type domain-containing protein n=1 Tax=Coilia grayii TaxID=363190 RepID=A0ABD1JXL3_9TELE